MTTDAPALRGPGAGSPEKARTALLYSVRLLSTMGSSLVLPLLPSIAGDFHLSAVEVSGMLVGFTMAEALTTPVAGLLSDRFGRKAVLMPAFFLFALGGVLCVFAHTWHQLFFCRVLQGIGGGALGVLYTILAADFYDERQLPTMMGRLRAVASIGSIVYPAVGGLLGLISWRIPMLLTALALPAAYLCLRIPLRRPGRKLVWAAYFKEVRAVATERQLLGFFLLVFLCYCIMYGPLNTYFSMMAQLRFNVPSSHIGAVFAFVAMGAWLASMSLPRFNARFSYRTLMLAAAVFYIVSQAGMLGIPTLWLYTIPLFVGGLAQGISLPVINDYVTFLAPSRDRAAILAVNETFIRFSQTVAPLLFGVAWGLHAWQGPYFMGTLMTLAIAVVTWRIYADKRLRELPTDGK